MHRLPLLAVACSVLVALSGCSRSPTDPAPEASIGAGIGDTVGYFTIQRINAETVDGSYNIPWPVSRPEGTPHTIRVGDEVGAACEGKTYTLTAIDQARQNVTFRENVREPSPGGCPICLAGGTMIATPDGPVNVKELRIGMPVWALVDGERESVPISKVSKTPSPHHSVVHLVLEDGRTLDASPGHHLADGTLFGALRAGDVVDGSPVVSARLVPYDEQFTYDLLAGEGYWANGILVASTLAPGAPPTMATMAAG